MLIFYKTLKAHEKARQEGSGNLSPGQVFTFPAKGYTGDINNTLDGQVHLSADRLENQTSAERSAQQTSLSGRREAAKVVAR
ncbi:hypothetical protein CA54_40700 [Symmachiella macrocystis]|uniref:Uncharacterized protein n=1 Tax=Symmachiella macrocystis TaxID=2527985 RepID=A0A5C6B9R7_9PLAN|nr:hypothetical protein CA54_40700 [Symmachiella macrocystis]